MLLNWLLGLRDRLMRLTKRQPKIVLRGRRSQQSNVAAMIEVLEPRRVMSAVAAVDDSYQIQQQQQMMTAPPILLDVLANDTSTGGPLSITSVTTPASGSVSIQHDANASMEILYGMTPTPDKLLFTPGYGFTGTETIS